VRIVQPSLVQGRIGEHFRMEWRPELAPEAAGRAPAAPAKPAPPPPAGAPGLDYFNSEAKP
jgi:hypothetical protein